LGVGEGARLTLLKQQDFPHSLGLLYSAFTYFTGFKVNSGEHKLMGLAPYGRGIYTQKILHELMDLREDGSFRLNLDYFGFLDDLVMTTRRFAELFGGPARAAESPITRRDMDIARSIQEATEEIVLRMARHARAVTGKRYLCMAGGVALNCVANGKLLRENIFDDLWIQPAAGDAGGALGAALAVWHNELGQPRVCIASDAMQGALLGPEFSDDQIREYLSEQDYPHTVLEAEQWGPRIAELVAEGNVVGLFHGRMEFGPRALGHRSIIGDARSPKMQSVLNLKIKQRESFRPFAPSVLEERAADYFELDRSSPYMLLVASVRNEQNVPAITHVDGSARVQTVSKATQPRYHELLTAFDRLTGCGLVINTSFNVRGEPIVCTPSDAYRCFMRTDMDYLVLGSFLLDKSKQQAWTETDAWKVSFQLD